MANEDKILVDREVLGKIVVGLNNVKLISNDKFVKKEVEDLLKLLKDEMDEDKIPLQEIIYEKMIEFKRSNPETSADLYIIYRKLSDGKISEKDALTQFELYVQVDSYEKKIF